MILRRLFLFLLFILLLTGATLLYIGTESGTKVIWNILINQFSDQISAEKMEGRLGDSLHFTNLKVKLTDLDITTEQLEFSWQPIKILKKEVIIDQIKIHDLIINDQRAPTPPSTEPIKLADIELPLAIKIKKFLLTKAEYHSSSLEKPLLLDQFSFSLDADKKRIKLDQLQAKMLEAELNLSGKLQPRGNYPLDFKLHWTAHLPDQPELKGSGSLHGNIEDLIIDQQLSEPTEFNLNIHLQQLLTNSPEFNLQGDWEDIQWPLTGVAIARTKQGEIHLTGQPENYQVKLKTDIYHAQTGDVVLNFKGNGNTKQFVIEELLSELLSGQFKTQGEVNWGVTPLTFDLSGDWKNINWQQIDTENPQQIKSPQGHFELSGQPEQYVVNLKTVLDGNQIPTGSWSISGTGTSSDFDLKSLHGDLLEGSLDLMGEFGWGEKLTWDIKLNGRGINPAALQQDWPGKLNLSTQISGQQVDDQLKLLVENTQIKGLLRGYPFNAQTNLSLIDDTLDLKQLILTSGQSILTASGQAGEKLDLSWTLKSQKLEELYPDAAGQLSAQGHINGTRKQPIIDATLNGKNIVAPGIKIGDLSSKIKLDLVEVTNKEKSNNANFELQINSSQIMLGENVIDNLDIIGDGSLAEHTVTADLKSEQGNLHFLTKGGLKDDQWTGTIQKLALEEKKLGRWQLSKPESLIVSKQQADLDQLCLSQESANLCLGGHWKASGAWRANSKLDQFPLSIVKPFLPADLTLDGFISSKLTASGMGNKNIRAKFDLKAPAGSIYLQNSEDKSQFKYEQAALDIAINDQGANASLLFNFKQPVNSPIKVTLKTPAFDLSSVDFSKLPLSGRLTSKVNDLSFIQDFTHEVEQLKGNLDVDLGFSGTVGKPKIKGHTKLDAEFFLPSAGIHLKEVNIEMNSQDDKTLAFTGHAGSGEGQLDLTGTIGLFDGPEENDFPINLEIKGDQFELINLPEAWVLASPKLSISQHSNVLNVEGEVTIPEAKIEPQSIASAVPVSDDVVIINDPSVHAEPTQEKQQELLVTTKVKVILGDKISLSASGFSGLLQGGLLVNGKPRKPITGSGEIKIKNGKFAAYGQKLDISKGHIIFAGGPIDAPNIDLEATRKIKSVTVGIHATGAATSPELTLFSTPGMNQDNILSYLLIGRPLGEASGDDSALLMKAASSLGLKGGEMLAQNIGQHLGLDEFSIGGESKEDASLQMGKYLTPKLYISYGVGLFEPVTQLKLRYDFSTRWSMDAESGSNSGMDFLYKIEK